MNLSLARSSLLVDIGIHIQILAYGYITMRPHVVYILDLCMILIFDLYVGGGGILSEFYSQFLSFGMICLFSKCNKNSTTWLRFLYITFYLCCKCATFLCARTPCNVMKRNIEICLYRSRKNIVQFCTLFTLFLMSVKLIS